MSIVVREIKVPPNNNYWLEMKSPIDKEKLEESWAGKCCKNNQDNLFEWLTEDVLRRIGQKEQSILERLLRRKQVPKIGIQDLGVVVELGDVKQSLTSKSANAKQKPEVERRVEERRVIAFATLCDAQSQAVPFSDILEFNLTFRVSNRGRAQFFLFQGDGNDTRKEKKMVDLPFNFDILNPNQNYPLSVKGSI